MFTYPLSPDHLGGSKDVPSSAERYSIISPACLAFAPGLKHFPKEASWRHPNQIPQPCQQAPLNTEEQRLNLEPLLDDWAPHSTSSSFQPIVFANFFFWSLLTAKDHRNTPRTCFFPSWSLCLFELDLRAVTWGLGSRKALVLSQVLAHNSLLLIQIC